MFSQDYRFNVCVCDGCECRCSLNARKSDKGFFYPVINGEYISAWVDEGGEYCPGLSHNAPDAIKLARKIAKVCDYYKTGVMPVSGAVKCMMCDLPDSEKCYLRWSPCVDDGSAYYATVGGEHCRFGSVAVDGMMLHSKGVEAKTVESALKQLRMYVSRHCEKVNSR